MILQNTVVLPNEPGALARMGKVLADAGIQVHALVVSTMSETSVVRLICDDPERASQELCKRRYFVRTSRVLAMEVSNQPGGLSALAAQITRAELNIEYVYCCPLGGKVYDIVCVSGEPVDVKLSAAGIEGLTQEDLA